jgi:hypothetical protein
MRGTLQEISLYRPTDLFWYRAECTPTSKVFVRSYGGLMGLVAARHGGPEKFDSMEHLASCANRVVLRVLEDINQLPVNVLTMDFVSDQVSAPKFTSVCSWRAINPQPRDVVVNLLTPSYEIRELNVFKISVTRETRPNGMRDYAKCAMRGVTQDHDAAKRKLLAKNLSSATA